jgi:hypothetical protein
MEIIKMFARNYDQSVISENYGSDKVFVLGGMSFMYIVKSKDPRLESWTSPKFYSSPV